MVVGVTAGMVVPSDALACTIGLIEHHLDEGEEPLDSTAPQTPEFVVDHIQRGVGPNGGDCDELSGSSCDDLGWISIRITGTGDGRTPDWEIGYEVEIVGDAPEGLAPSYPVRVNGEDPRFMLTWIDEAIDDQESLSFQVSLRAIDLAGNMSESSEPVEVIDPGGASVVECDDEPSDGGCVASGEWPGPLGGLLLVLVGLLAARRRDAPQSPGSQPAELRCGVL